MGARLVVTLLLCLTLKAGVRPGMLVTTEWLAGRLDDPSLVVLHVGTAKDYEAGHIPGARLVTLGDLSITGENGLRLEMPAADALEAALGRLGIGDDSRVIVYAGNETLQAATRIWFTLDYVGLGERAALLDGGLGLWREEGRSLTTETPRFEPPSLNLHPRSELIVRADWVREHLTDSSVLLLDARTPEFYTGANPGTMPRAGRIPGARNVPFPSVFDEHRRLRPESALRELLGASDNNAGKLRVSYCHIGLQATVLYFVARYLDLDVRLYDGSFQDWSSQPELPVSTGDSGR